MPDEEGRFRLVIVGSSDYWPDDEVFAAIERMVARHPKGVVVYAKDQEGVAKVAWQQAAVLGVPYEIDTPEPDDDAPLTAKVSATSDQNARLVAKADTVLAFFHPGPTADLAMTSSGTMNALHQAAGAKVPIFAHHEGKWTVGGPPTAPTSPPDGWTVPKGYRATSTTSRCGSQRRAGCGAEILWSENPRGSKVPLNPDGTSHLDTCPVRAKERRNAR